MGEAGGMAAGALREPVAGGAGGAVRARAKGGPGAAVPWSTHTMGASTLTRAARMQQAVAGA